MTDAKKPRGKQKTTRAAAPGVKRPFDIEQAMRLLREVVAPYKRFPGRAGRRGRRH
jgi:hypothetical protein